jgi:HTH-type transcriptional regulator/antitoxin HipB
MKQILSLSKQLGPVRQSARKAAGLSQTELAQRLGIRRVSAIADPGSINVDQLLALLAALSALSSRYVSGLLGLIDGSDIKLTGTLEIPLLITFWCRLQNHW